MNDYSKERKSGICIDLDRGLRCNAEIVSVNPIVRNIFELKNFSKYFQINSSNDFP